MGLQRSTVAMMWALMVAFFIGVNRLDGDRWAQAGVALAYAVAMVLLMRRAKHRMA